MRFFIAAVFSTLFCQSVQAGPVFSLVGVSPLTAAHPTGIGNRTASGSWGISGTGGGFLDGTLTFADSFVLPGDGEFIAFSAGDLDRLDYQHVESAFVGGSAPNPRFSFSADSAAIESASGFVRNLGGGVYDLTSVSVQTTVTASIFRILPGFLHVVTGDFLIAGDTVGLRADTYNDIPQPPGTFAMMITSSQYPGGWRLTGTTTGVPLPAALLLFLSGLGVLLVSRGRT